MSIRKYEIERLFVPQIRFMRDWVLNRLLPTFENLEQQADQITNDQYLNTPGDEYSDPADTAESAFEAGLDFYMEATAFRQGFLNLQFVHVYHLFEKQVASIVRHENVILPDGTPSREFQFRSSAQLLDGVFNAVDIDPTLVPGWDSVAELRLIANTVKHVDAKASATLRAQRPELFEPPFVREQDPRLRALYSGHPVESALTGQDFFPQVEEYQQQVDGLIAYWGSFGAVLDQERAVIPLRDRVLEQRAEIIELARTHGATNVRLFGSVARGEAGPSSDVDLLVDLNQGTTFCAEDDLREQLTNLLGRKVDLHTHDSLKARIRGRALMEAVSL